MLHMWVGYLRVSLLYCAVLFCDVPANVTAACCAEAMER